MNDVIHVNTTSRLLTTLTGHLSQTKGAFEGALQDARAAAAAQYRVHIEEMIRAMPVHKSRLGDNFRIDISDAGYEAMQNDPSYEEFVLDTVRTELSAPALPSAGSATVILQFGEDPSRLRKHAFSAGDDFFHVIEEDKSFWEERLERQEELEETNDRIADIRRRVRALTAEKHQKGESVSAAELAASSEILTLLLEEMLHTGL